MKAEDFLHSKEIESATCITNKATYYLKDLIIILNEYARIQIDKDREEIIKEHLLNDNGIIARKIRSKPINLD